MVDMKYKMLFKLASSGPCSNPRFHSTRGCTGPKVPTLNRSMIRAQPENMVMRLVGARFGNGLVIVEFQHPPLSSLDR